MLNLIRHIYEREIPSNPAYWHPWNLFLPTKTKNGWVLGLVWRRQTSQGFEYQKREETDEEWVERQI